MHTLYTAKRLLWTWFIHLITPDHHVFAVNIQHDAGEVLLAILNLTQQQMNAEPLVCVHLLASLTGSLSSFHTCVCLCCQALEIENLYKISLETYVQCLECSSVQAQTSYLLSLPLHVKEDHNSLVPFLFFVSTWIIAE